ncbi:MAG: penicillin-binding protein [Deltaproteobacteria bacterium]|nr:penicillin-binding protein [Deltaproteobacteria bacterium]
MTETFERWIRFRLVVILLIFISFLTIIGIRAYQLQILKRPTLFQKAERQGKQRVELKSSRGVVYDRNHNELAVSVEVDSVYAHPGQVVEPRKTAVVLGDLLEEDSKKIHEDLRSSSPFRWLKRGISPARREEVESKRLAGVCCVKESKRFYPHCEIGGHLLGFVGEDGYGLEGLECKYDSCLAGESAYLVVERDGLGHQILSLCQTSLDVRDGHDLVLTVDLTVQYILEKELEKAVENAHARGGMGIVMNPKTGEVLGLALQPHFNPNNFRNASPSIWRNRAVIDCFDPGSTFKVFLAAAALEENVISPEEVIDCENGSYQVADRTIHDVHKYENLTFVEVLAFSSNIGAVKISERLDDATFYQYIRAFGFGDKTGMDLPAESAGLVRPYQQWRDIDMRTISFGQGIAVTALQLINGLCVIANGGYLMRPYIVKEVVTKKGETLMRNYPHVIRNVISEKTCQTIRDLMVVVVESGTGQSARINGFPVAGKTGTAQKVDHETGSFSQSKFTGSFMGFVPAYDPRIAVLIVIDEPRGRGFGGTVAAPAFKQISEQVLNYLNVLPQYDPSIAGVEKNLSKKSLEQPGADLEKDQYGLHCVPNFIGLSMRRVLQLAQSYPLTVQIEGTGRAVSQRPSPGTPLRSDTECRVSFEPVT